MLDRSVPFKNIIMAISPDDIKNIPVSSLPEGFGFRLFSDRSDIEHWARIETSVREFNTERLARVYFERDYMPYFDELIRRCVFIVSPENTPVATATAWFSESRLGRQELLDWVAVCPEYQGLGLGRAAASYATRLFLTLSPGHEVLLHTQTWSHKAVVMYHHMGYRVQKTRLAAAMTNREPYVKIPPNDFSEAMEIIRPLISGDIHNEIISRAE